MSTNEKKVVNAAEFEKQVEIEASYLIYIDRLKKDEAFKKARDFVTQLYTVQER